MSTAVIIVSSSKWIAPSIESDVIGRQKELNVQASSLLGNFGYSCTDVLMPQDADGSKHVESGIKSGCGSVFFFFFFLLFFLVFLIDIFPLRILFCDPIFWKLCVIYV